jgi:glycosyltransferase involved in cell wall biosynthesis
MQLFVLGMHRSGTSSVTRLLNMAGAYFGPEGISNGADEGNPKGYWERRDVRAACDGLLQQSGYDWWKVSEFSLEAIPTDVRTRHLGALDRILLELDAHRPWVLKEPRLCLLFPLLRPRLEVPICIHVAREPLEVAQSLEARNGFPTNAGVALWELYTIHSLRATAGLPRVHIRYENLTRAPVDTTADLIARLVHLGADGLRVPSRREIEAFVTPTLHRRRRSADARPLVMNHQQVELAAAIDARTILHEGGLPDEVSEGALSTLRVFEEYQARAERLERLESDVRSRDALVHDLEQRLAGLRAETAEGDARINDLERRLVGQRQDYERHLRAMDLILDRLEDRVGAVRQSRTWRFAECVLKARLRVTPGVAHNPASPLDGVVTDIKRARANLKDNTEDADPSAAWKQTNRQLPVPRTSSKRLRTKVAVIAWDVGHNPVGRAHTLAGILGRHYHTEIWGAQFERYGSEIWPPLRGSDIPIRTFRGESLPDHFASIQEISRNIDADVLYVSKPRFPSLALGILAKEARNRLLLLDVDDDELAFFGETAGLDPFELLHRHSDPNLLLPFDRLWTRASVQSIGDVDCLTVSNETLQERYGGTIIPHARDERVFDPAHYDRVATRRGLGIDERVHLLLFGGTPRLHKGIVDILRALDDLGDNRYRLMVFDSREWYSMRRDIGDLDRWLITVPYQPATRLPAVVAASDLACVLQDPRHPATSFQIPAKITDAMAMRVPCLVRPAPPLRSLIDQGVVEVWHSGEALADRIASIFDRYGDALDRAERARAIFEADYSYQAVAERLVPVVESHVPTPPRLTPALASLTEAARRLFGPDDERIHLAPRAPGPRRRSVSRVQKYDIAMFWKQNDSGIYGRRSDMLLKYLERSGRVRSIIHFDAPIAMGKLYTDYRRSSRRADQTRLIVRHTVRRVLRLCNTDRIHNYTFVHSAGAGHRGFVRPRSAYVDFVQTALRRHEFGTGPTLLWGYPVNRDLPILIDAIQPDLVVTDVVDDHRTFAEPGTQRHADFERNYREVLARSDIVFANCERVATSIADFGSEAYLIPNGLELPDDTVPLEAPSELTTLRRPIIGYVGNLSQRVDVDLLEEIVDARPHWQFVFVGSAHHDRRILSLDARCNVHFAGPTPYDRARAFIGNFDVAIVPHVDSDMTRSMSPLKAYVYCSLGVPVVSTPVANLGELSDLIVVARGAQEFVSAIEAALRVPRSRPNIDALRPHSWEARVGQALAIIDKVMAVDRD